MHEALSFPLQNAVCMCVSTSFGKALRPSHDTGHWVVKLLESGVQGYDRSLNPTYVARYPNVPW
eukprot:4965837-Prymnesium_polylepis.1